MNTDLFDRIQEAFREDTRRASLADVEPASEAIGHDDIAALLVREELGGHIVTFTVVDMETNVRYHTHYANVLPNGMMVDVTWGMFYKPVIIHGPSTPKEILQTKSFKRRFKTFKARVEAVNFSSQSPTLSHEHR